MKKAQIQTMESIAVLLVFFIILMLVFVFYATYQRGNIEEKSKELAAEEAVQIAQEIANLPELECTGAGIEIGVDCFDRLKLESMTEAIEESIELRAGIYQERFANSRITISEFYSLPGKPKTNWTLYERIPDQTKSEYYFETMVSILDPTSNVPIGTRSIGVLEIVYYE